jgi:hypothetical protein
MILSKTTNALKAPHCSGWFQRSEDAFLQRLRIGAIDVSCMADHHGFLHQSASQLKLLCFTTRTSQRFAPASFVELKSYVRIDFITELRERSTRSVVTIS